jgi:hypothetical protein
MLVYSDFKCFLLANISNEIANNQQEETEMSLK